MRRANRHILFCFCLLASSAHAGNGTAYAVIGRLTPGGDGGWDYPSVDSRTHLLYQSRADHVSVVNTKTGKEVGQITETPGVHGIALAPALGRGFISAGKANRVTVFDLKTRAVVGSVSTGEGPDSIVYEPVSQRVVSFNGHGHSATVIDARSNTAIVTLPLDGKPEFAQADGRGAIYFNIEDTGELGVIDGKSAVLKGRWKLPHCEEPSGFALDTAHRRSFSTCANQTLAVMDIDSGKAVANVPIDKGVDGCAFDPASGNVFSANGEGTLTVVHETDPDHFQVRQTLVTQAGARTIALDKITHRLYLPTAQFGLAPEPSAEHPHPRPPPLPGTFVVLVVGRP